MFEKLLLQLGASKYWQNCQKRGFQFNATTEIRSGGACLPCHGLFLILKLPFLTISGALCLSTGKSGFNATGL